MEENQTAAPVERIPSLPPKITRENFTPPIPPTKAKIMLREEATLIQEISDMMGFSTPDYFSRVFKKRSGYSPTAYRNLALIDLKIN